MEDKNKNELQSLVERIETLDSEKDAIGQDIKEVYAEAKSVGFDIKVLKEVIKLRKMDQSERNEHDTLLDIYKSALGVV